MPEPLSAALPELLVCRALLGELDRGRPTVVVAVVSQTDGSPGRTGWIMAVARDGWRAGTVGGGAPEETAVRRSLAMLDSGATRPTRLTQTHRPKAEHASGLLCGGEQVLALVPLAAASRRGLRAAVDVLVRGERFTWSPAEDVSLTLGPTHRVVVVGAGHVGQALAPLVVRLGFRVDVVDERAGAAARMHDVARAVHPLAYASLTDLVPPGERTFVVVATHAPERDAAAVTALAATQLGYLGVLGTPSKLAHLPGRPELEVPAGMPIGSHAPNEIAVSIAARLVTLRAGRVTGGKSRT